MAAPSRRAPAREPRCPASRRTRPAPRQASGSAATSASATSSCAPADRMPLDAAPPRPGRTRRHEPASRAASTRRSSSSWTARLIRLPQVGERSSARAVLALELVRIAKRGRQPQDLGRVERLGHSPCRHVVPPGPSSKTMPSALSSSRIRSAVAKSRFFLASARSAIRASMASSRRRIALEPRRSRALEQTKQSAHSPSARAVHRMRCKARERQRRVEVIAKSARARLASTRPPRYSPATR